MNTLFDDDFGNEYKYEYVGTITFETPECIIANGSCPIKASNRDLGDKVEYAILNNLRIKEPWDCFIKIRIN